MVKFSALYSFSFAVILAASLQVSYAGRSFEINYEKDSFYMDGKPFRYVSGSAHYFRMPSEYWRDRLKKIRAAGLNAVSTYVEWSQHEPIIGHYNFNGDLDVKKFIRIAQEEDLFVILRPGPYICAERDMGGLPYWLMTEYPDIQLRTQDHRYTKHVERWINVLMTELSPLLYGNGGPIILVQVENEYGSYHSCDFNHTIWLRDLFKKHVRNHAVLFTTDGASKSLLKCGKIPGLLPTTTKQSSLMNFDSELDHFLGVYATIDFGPHHNVTKAFEQLRAFEPKGPLVNSEYYPGWLTHWGEKMSREDTLSILKTLREMLEMGANVNFYMFYGGTNFGFTAGANNGNKYVSDITSYDYDAPLTEAGDITDKYRAIKEVVFQYLSSSNKTVESSGKGDYGEISLKRVATLFSPKMREKLGILHHHTTPKSFEALGQNFGYLLYETVIPQDTFNVTFGKLQIRRAKDLAHVFMRGNLIGNISREFSTDTVYIKNVSKGGTLSVIVENLGRVNFGSKINDTKGILSDVTLEGKELKPWNMTSFKLNDVNAVVNCATEFANNTISECDNDQGFTFYINKFKLPRKMAAHHELDSFIDVSHLTKGLIFINGFNLGRYWSWRGPQYTIYVPGVYLNSFPKQNTIIIMEENITTDYINVKFRKTPIFT